MNREAVEDMVEAYRTQNDILATIDDNIAWHIADKTLIQALLQRKREIIAEQRAIYLMLVDEYCEGLDIKELLYDIYKYITTDPPPGFG